MENSVSLMRLLVPSPLASSGTPPQACEDTCGLVLISLSPLQHTSVPSLQG